MAKHILLVDDDALMRRSLTFNLEQAGYRVSAAANAEDALALARRDSPDLILLDIGLPGMDGLDLTKAVKHLRPDIDVVVITGYPTIESAKEAVRLGAQNYIAKPVGPAEVVKAANEAWTHKRWAMHRNQNDREADDLVERKPDSRPVTH